MAEEANIDETVVSQDAPVVEEPTTQDSSPVEETVVEESEEIATSEEPIEDETQTSEPEEEVSEAPAEDMPEGLAPKSQNRFQKLANRNRVLEDRVKELEQFKVPTEEDYLEGGYEPVEAKVNAMQAALQQRDAIEHVRALNQDVETDMLRILHEFPQLNQKSKDYNETLAMSLFNQYEIDTNPQFAEGGIVLNMNQLPYEYIKNKMDLIGMASANERVKAQKSVERMVSAAETPTSKAPAISDDDSLDSMKEKLADFKF